MNNLRQHGLAVMATPSKPIVFYTGWSTERCNQFFADLMPDLFAYLKTHPHKAGPKVSKAVQEQQWLGVIKTNQSISLAAEELPTGADLNFISKRKGQKASEHILFIATKIRIPEERYRNWDLLSDSDVPDAEDEEEDFDMLDEHSSSPPKPAPQSKGKGKAKALYTSPIKGIKLERLVPEPLPDMKQAAKMRTRLGTNTIKWNKVQIPNSSDDEQPQPIEVSDDELELPDASTLASASKSEASTLAASNAHMSAISSALTSPLFTSFDKSPSPEQDFSTSFDASEFSVPPSPSGDVSAHSSGWASTSSLVSSTSQPTAPPVSGPNLLPTSAENAPSMTTSSGWASTSSLSHVVPSATSTGGASSSSLASNTGAEPSSSAAGPSRPSLFKRGGKSKGLVNPWSKKS
ncbi:hypothetical protein DFH07DRAFT_50944 [Mycena maculata]|uniref:Uncharacterized protein n=1 Tax=Mycena maculata TaxID=230809 RepID=A0AAD7IGR5_9AGAR|nr:hypothetical protein DFH07DRAFT_50944 [Mycena maculata]